MSPGNCDDMGQDCGSYDGDWFWGVWDVNVEEGTIDCCCVVPDGSRAIKRTCITIYAA